MFFVLIKNMTKVKKEINLEAIKISAVDMLRIFEHAEIFCDNLTLEPNIDHSSEMILSLKTTMSYLLY